MLVCYTGNMSVNGDIFPIVIKVCCLIIRDVCKRKNDGNFGRNGHKKTLLQIKKGIFYLL